VNHVTKQTQYTQPVFNNNNNNNNKNNSLLDKSIINSNNNEDSNEVSNWFYSQLSKLV